MATTLFAPLAAALILVGCQSPPSPAPRTAVPSEHPSGAKAPYLTIAATGVGHSPDTLEVELILGNPTHHGISFSGYDATSFEPHLLSDQISPTYSQQIRADEGWLANNPGFCGVGMGTQKLDAGGAKWFKVYLSHEDMPARIGVRYTLDDAPTTVWSDTINVN